MLTLNSSYTQMVYDAVSEQEGRGEALRYATLVFTVPIVFGVQFLYEYGSIAAETSNLTAFGRVIVAAFVVTVGPLPVLALVAPPDPITLVRVVGGTLLAATPAVYFVLFRVLGFDVTYGPGTTGLSFDQLAS